MLVILPNAFGEAAANMAIDAALLETLPEESAVFRHYAWTEPAITFGYSQHYAEVAAATPAGVTRCRRMTGGGIVDHRNDWTYTLILQNELAAAQGSSTDLYATVHTTAAEAIADQGVHTQLAPCPRQCDRNLGQNDGPDHCFLQPAMNDVLTNDGRKMAGAAMKRTRQGILLQGSIDRSTLPPTFDFDAFSRNFAQLLSGSLGLTIEQPEDLRPLFNAELIEQEKERFGSEAWTFRR